MDKWCFLNNQYNKSSEMFFNNQLKCMSEYKDEELVKRLLELDNSQVELVINNFKKEDISVDTKNLLDKFAKEAESLDWNAIAFSHICFVAAKEKGINLKFYAEQEYIGSDGTKTPWGEKFEKLFSKICENEKIVFKNKNKDRQF